MNLEHLWAVRDARGLNYKEKTFLFVLVSRGEEGMYGKWQRNAADMGLSKGAYYDARDSLISKGLIVAKRNFDSSTHYIVVENVLFEYRDQSGPVPDTGTRVPYTGTPVPDTGMGCSVYDETKDNKKKNMKDNLKVNNTTVADAPVVEEVRESQKDSKPSLVHTTPGEAGVSNDDTSTGLLVPPQAATPGEEETGPDSGIRNEVEIGHSCKVGNRWFLTKEQADAYRASLEVSDDAW